MIEETNLIEVRHWVKVDKVNADFQKCSAVPVLVGLSPNEKRQNRMIEKDETLTVDHGTKQKL